jgi:uncharacterized protein YyaL (SSP411 family)
MSQLNRLQHESSPYLRQHAANPVDWYAWGPEALERARRENKPIFLSIGYSACHWCHVMEHESFMDPETAAFMNQHFINIKVDREERPDLDQIYMNAVVALTGQGGWPMSVWLTPSLEPFSGGTYFPPQDQYGRPAFRRVLAAIAEAWRSRHDELVHHAQEITQHLQASMELKADGGELGPDLLRLAVQALDRAFDSHYGGFGRAPKFPHALELKLLLRAARRFQDEEALKMAEVTLDRMARGGMYDHLGGGFHRYSTDARWLVPHFEKMLYDNALLAQVYLEAYQGTGKSFYRDVVEETLAWVEREMIDPAGGFYSTLDADSEGVEGKFYVWTQAEIEEHLDRDLAELVISVYDVSPAGNWEGHTILNRPKTLAQDARLLKLSEEELASRLRAAREKLLAVREQRVRPGRDDKMLTAWNGLMINAFALAAQVLDPRYAGPARRAAEFVLNKLRAPDGRLLRTVSPGGQPKLNGYLEDYTFFIDSLVSLYEADFDPIWLERALELTDLVVAEFWDETEGGFFFVGKSHEPMIIQDKAPHDGSVPSGNSMAAIALLRLARLTGRGDLAERAVRTIQLVRSGLEATPTAFGQMLVALDYHLGPVEEFAVVGDAAAKDTQEALRLVRQGFRPNKVVAFLDSTLPTAERERLTRLIPLLAGKDSVGGEVTTYVCRDFACAAPLVGLEAMRAAGRKDYSPQTSPMTSSET